ncbi:MAG: sulfatase-like hydrolase/transferase [Akkermansia sp.]|nr:sulfatase-like hydrolase/transferase [Akkermansia sp.]
MKGYKWGTAVTCLSLAAACVFLYKKRGGVEAFLPSKAVWQIALAMLVANIALNVDLWLDMPQLGHAMLFGMGLCCLLLTASRWLFGILFSLCFLCSFVDAVSRVKYGILLNKEVVMQVLDANAMEVQNYLTWDVALLLAAALLFIAGLVWWLLRATRGQGRLRLLGTGLLLLLASTVARQYTIPLNAKSSCGEWPFQLTRMTIKAFADASDGGPSLLRTLEKLPHMTKDDVSVPALKGGEGVVCILHIGESVRADHTGIYGYHRDTTPWLGANGRLVHFDRCVSFAPFTTYAMYGIMSDACGNTMIKDAPHTEPTVRSLADVFAACGFKECTFSQVSRTEHRGILGKGVCECLLELFSESGEMVAYSGDPMQQIPQILGKVGGEPETNRFILINNEGSHVPFAWYDKANPPFSPADPQGRRNSPASNPDMAELARNAYDNTICYTDEYIRRLVEGLGNRPFVYLYVSDHGEYLGDDGGLWERGQAEENYCRTNGCLVPLLVIASPEFEALHPHFREAMERLRANHAVTASQDNVFHTLLGIFGISTAAYRAELDLSSDRVQPYTGEQPGSPAATPAETPRN